MTISHISKGNSLVRLLPPFPVISMSVQQVERRAYLRRKLIGCLYFLEVPLTGGVDDGNGCGFSEVTDLRPILTG